MSTAQEIKNIGDWVSAIEKAQEVAVETEQDWKNEKTMFIFEDGSKIEFSGPDMEVVN